MVKIIDRYILKYFFSTFLVVTLAVGLTIVVINMIEGLPDFIDHEVPMLKILEYYLYFSGWVIKSFVPVFVMLSVLFAISILARRQEVLAMKACGLSLYRITLPLFVVSVIIACGHFYFNEYVFPPANKKRAEMKQFDIKQRSRASVQKVRNIHRQIEQGSFYTIGSFDAQRRLGTEFKLFRVKDNQLIESIVAEKIVFMWNPEDIGGLGDNQEISPDDSGLVMSGASWRAIDGIRRQFDGDKINFEKFDTLPLPHVREKPENLAKRIGKPEDMGLEELKDYIKTAEAAGVPTLRERVDLEMKYSFPLVSIIVVLIAVPFAANPRRGGIAVSFAAGALFALAYFVLFRMTQSAAYNDKLPIWVAVWGTNALFFLFGAFLMLRARK